MMSRPLIAEVFVRALYVILLCASLWVLVRGHNYPGGGFIGGLLAVAASAAYALVFDSARALRRLPFGPVRLAAGGALLALASGLPSLLQGEAFLAHRWLLLSFAGLEIPLSTVMLFDLGVYLCVWGAIGGYGLLLIGAIEESP
jgi:multicomponent Na+:H+ antiporter subunit B